MHHGVCGGGHRQRAEKRACEKVESEIVEVARYLFIFWGNVQHGEHRQPLRVEIQQRAVHLHHAYGTYRFVYTYHHVSGLRPVDANALQPPYSPPAIASHADRCQIVWSKNAQCQSTKHV